MTLETYTVETNANKLLLGNIEIRVMYINSLIGYNLYCFNWLKRLLISLMQLFVYKKAPYFH